MERAWLFLTLLALAGCQSSPADTEKVWQRYVGLPVTDLVVKAGPPTANFPMGDGRQAFQWKIEGFTSERVGRSIASSPVTCVVTFYATKISPGEGYAGWKVIGFAPAGANC